MIYERLVGISGTTSCEPNIEIRDKIQIVWAMPAISWRTYPVGYLFPVLGINAAAAMLSIQIGYYAFDIISKCEGGIVHYQISRVWTSACLRDRVLTRVLISVLFSRIHRTGFGSFVSRCDDIVR